MVINLFVVWYERRRATQLGSAFLMADAAHTQSDIYVTLAAVGSLILTRAGWGFIDPILAILVALIAAIPEHAELDAQRRLEKADDEHDYNRDDQEYQ